jgi:hypothetical protein
MEEYSKYLALGEYTGGIIDICFDNDPGIRK